MKFGKESRREAKGKWFIITHRHFLSSLSFFSFGNKWRHVTAKCGGSFSTIRLHETIVVARFMNFIECPFFEVLIRHVSLSESAGNLT